MSPTALPHPSESSHDVTATLSASHTGDTRTIAFPQRAAASAPPVLTPPPALPPEPGTQVDSYILEQKLGEGVSCHVYRGRDEARGRPVALKILNWTNVFDRAAAMKQLRMEAAALARVHHPAVVGFIDFGFDPRWPYLVTEFIEGQPLGEIIRDGGALPARWALHLMSQMVDALGAVWKAGLVHRDIKPDNILLCPDGTGKLIDFGLALSGAIEANNERTGPEVAGTAAYLAPEQAKDASAVDHRADIYSLGVTFYETLTGRLPFDGKNRMQMLFHHLNTPPVPPVARIPGLPTLASDLCLWMLCKNPDDRPQNYDELRQAFNTVMGRA